MTAIAAGAMAVAACTGSTGRPSPPGVGLAAVSDPPPATLVSSSAYLSFTCADQLGGTG